MLHLFKFELVEPKKTLMAKDFWFHKQSGLNVRVHIRDVANGGVANGGSNGHV